MLWIRRWKLLSLTFLYLMGCGGGAQTTVTGPKLVLIGGQSITGKAGETLQFKVLVETNGFENIQFSWSISGPVDVKDDPNNAPKVISSGNEHTFVWTPRNDQAGTYQVVLELTAPGAPKDSLQVTLTIEGSSEGISLLGGTTFPFSVSIDTIEIDFQFDAPSIGDLDYTLTNQAEGMQIAPHPTKPHTARFSWEPTIEQKGDGNKTYSFTLQAKETGGTKTSPSYPIVVFLRKCDSIDPQVTLETQGQLWTDEGVRVEATNSDYEFALQIVEQGTAISRAQLCYYPAEDTNDITCIEMQASGTRYAASVPNANLEVGETKKFGVFFRVTDACGKTQEYIFSVEKGWDYLLYIAIPKPLDYGSLCEPSSSSCPQEYATCHPDLTICTKSCATIVDCPTNSDCVGTTSKYCVPASRSNCAPCKTDAECGPGGLCSQIGDIAGVPVKVCSGFCDADTKCPDGYQCTGNHCSLIEGQCRDVDRGGLCKPCTAHSDCGDYKDRCIGFDPQNPGTPGYCGQDCESIGCPFGYTCTNVDNAGLSPDPVKDPWGWQCLPPDGNCQQVETPQPPTAETLLVNEIFPNAKDVDANMDGVADQFDDEFIELVNISDKPIDLTDVSIDDDDTSTGSGGYNFTFPAGTILKPGKAAIIFGGGDLQKIKANDWGEGNLVFIATTSRKLSLGNSGDTILLIYQSATLWSGSYGNTSTSVSWTRKIDGDPASAFVKHTEATNASGNYSPGKRVDQTPF
ncbi:MAG: lamin tail domain-containing protein [Myxococcales bacterium]|nr:lamin tail domain-containing protein [Myxococcales bacterium]